MNEQEIAQLLDLWENGDRHAFSVLIDHLYPEIKAIAVRHMMSERPDHTLQATALVNEAFLRLQAASPRLQSSAHLKNLIGATMRRVLVDYARQKNRKKRGSDFTIIPLTSTAQSDEEDVQNLLALDEALTELSEADIISADILCAFYFGGMTYKEMATSFGLAESTVHSKLKLARAWLHSRADT